MALLQQEEVHLAVAMLRRQEVLLPQPHHRQSPLLSLPAYRWARSSAATCTYVTMRGTSRWEGPSRSRFLDEQAPLPELQQTARAPHQPLSQLGTRRLASWRPGFRGCGRPPLLRRRLSHPSLRLPLRPLGRAAAVLGDLRRHASLQL